MENNDCVFCRIVAGEIPSARLYDDSDVIAILDVNPISRGHLLVIPKHHFEYLENVDAETFGKVAEVARRFSSHMVETGFCAGTNLFLANHETANQSVFHLHMHVIPRRTNDGINIAGWWKEISHGLQAAEMKELASKLSIRK
ncbi:MAG: HIT family protein [Thermoplasmata archaeon]